ncbi:MAG: phasin family protein [Microcystaceae cyanobacterium]
MMALGDIVQKAVYLGIGLASYAGENLGELREQAQKLADEMVERGKMNAEEARQYVDKVVQQAQQELQQQQQQQPSSKTSNTQNEPRRIEIIEEEEVKEDSPQEDIDKLRQQVQSLQDELRNIKKK